ncbi:hypothetical protein N7520_001279 [Penicillium odoratum]|uniref:uncharacterized protein n=1 Tax=Penicillium odoratum TaxID=1167516 RepID=UPI002547698E|nr:uncharacterized protein N7520_001279 [Penicillium odoratum]KAJ5778033.1 hypothetical protein N7520_001279 [Penicillium odoratum]
METGSLQFARDRRLKAIHGKSAKNVLQFMSSAIKTIPALAEDIAALELSEIQRETDKLSAATQSKAIEDNMKSEVKDEDPLDSASKEELKDEIKEKVGEGQD